MKMNRNEEGKIVIVLDDDKDANDLLVIVQKLNPQSGSQWDLVEAIEYDLKQMMKEEKSDGQV